MQKNSGVRTFEVGAGGVSEYSLVKLDAGKIVTNTSLKTAIPIGVARTEGAEGDFVAVLLINLPGTIEMIASEPISSGSIVYGADNGEILSAPADPDGYVKIGLAIGTASAVGSIIEVMPYNFGTITTL